MSELDDLEQIYTSTMPDRSGPPSPYLDKVDKARNRWKQLLCKNGKSLHARVSSSRAHRKVTITLAKVRVA